jgi:hypothetical protein
MIDQGFLFRLPPQTQHGTVTVEFMNRAIEAEREACAKVCEDGLNIATCLNALDDMEMWGEKFAAAIRARGQA